MRQDMSVLRPIAKNLLHVIETAEATKEGEQKVKTARVALEMNVSAGNIDAQEQTRIEDAVSVWERRRRYYLQM